MKKFINALCLTASLAACDLQPSFAAEYSNAPLTKCELTNVHRSALKAKLTDDQGDPIEDNWALVYKYPAKVRAYLAREYKIEQVYYRNRKRPPAPPVGTDDLFGQPLVKCPKPAQTAKSGH